MSNITRNVQRVSRDLEGLRYERQHAQEERDALALEVQKAEEEISKLVRLQGELKTKKLELSHATQNLSHIADEDSGGLRQRVQVEHDALALEVQKAEEEISKLVRLKRELRTKKLEFARAARKILRMKRQKLRLDRELRVLERQLRDMRDHR